MDSTVLNNSDEDCLQAEFEFNREIVKDKFTQEEYMIILMKED